MSFNYDTLQTIHDLAVPSNRVDRIVETKPLSSIPASVAREIKLISLSYQPKGVSFGSYNNRISNVFGDIDTIQLVDNFKSLEAVGPKTTKAIKQVVNRILTQPNHWFSEAKAGIDSRYYFDIGTLSNGHYTFSPELLPKTMELAVAGLLDEDEMYTLNEILTKGSGNAEDYDLVYNIFRNRYVLRWSSKEILRGYKTLPGKIKYKLEQAIFDRTAVKIDMIVFLNGKYIEITNFILIAYENQPINIDPSTTTPSNLPYDIEKLYYSDYYYSPFKAVKRSFAYLKWVRNQPDHPDRYSTDEYLIKYSNILKKTINILYTIRSEIDAMAIIQPQLKSKYHKLQLRKRINELKQPLSNVLELSDEMLEIFNQYMDNPQMNLKILYNLFGEIINAWTIQYFKDEGINPPPKIVLPNIMSYDPNLVRQS